jgi:RES domain-containing protein
LIRVYRILRKAYSKKPLDGEGAYRFGGRWSSPGTRLAYTSEHLSLATLEYLVHVDPDEPPEDLVVVAADIPANVSRAAISVKKLLPHWRQSPAPPELAAFGDEHVRRGRDGVPMVPSALSPTESNWLINPEHVDFSRIRVRPPEAFGYDRRILR